MLLKSKILLGLTTTTGSDWRKKISDIDRLNIQDIALFLTGIDRSLRLELYELIEKTNLKKISHIHLRNDMGEDEISYLINKFDVKYLNIHSSNTKHLFDINIINKFKNNIYIENNYLLLDENREELNSVSGVCIDFSHFEAYFLENGLDDKYLQYEKIVEDYKIGCCHVSAVKKNKDNDSYDTHRFDFHCFDKLSEFDYLKKYEKYFPEFLSLELENDFDEQIKVRGYVENLF